MNRPDYVGTIFMLAWGAFALWFANRFVHSRDTLGSLFTTWPIARPKEFIIWACMGAVVGGLLCVLLFTEDNSTRLARQYSEASGTFIEYLGIHGVFRYQFTVRDLVYHGFSDTDQNLDKIQQGYPFTVYYYPPNPNINDASEPVRRLIIGQVMLTFFAVLFMGVLAIIVRKLGALMREATWAPSNNASS